MRGSVAVSWRLGVGTTRVSVATSVGVGAGVTGVDAGAIVIGVAEPAISVAITGCSTACPAPVNVTQARVRPPSKKNKTTKGKRMGFIVGGNLFFGNRQRNDWKKFAAANDNAFDIHQRIKYT